MRNPNPILCDFMWGAYWWQNSPRPLRAGERVGDCIWFSSAEWPFMESRLRCDCLGGRGGGGRGGVLSGQSIHVGISGRGMSGALRILSRCPSARSRELSFLGFMNFTIALAPTQWRLLCYEKNILLYSRFCNKNLINAPKSEVYSVLFSLGSRDGLTF